MFASHTYVRYPSRVFWGFLKMFFGRQLSFCGFTGTCFGFLVTSPLGFKTRASSALFALSRDVHYMFPEVHFWCDTLSTS